MAGPETGRQYVPRSGCIVIRCATPTTTQLPFSNDDLDGHRPLGAMPQII